MLLGHLGIVLCKLFSCSPQSESSDTQRSRKGPGWIPRQLFLLPREYLIARCWVRPGLWHLPTFLGKVSYCAEKLPSYVRAGRGWANAKGSICSVQVTGFIRCWSPIFVMCGSSVVVAFLCWCQGSAWLHHMLQLPVCWTFRAEIRSSTVKSVQSCASGAQLSLSVQPCWQSYATLSSTTTLFSAYIKIFPLYFSSKLRHS